MANKNLINTIIGIAVLAVVLILLLVILPDGEDQDQQPVPGDDQEEQMLTYQNKEFNFTLQYPETWQVEEQTELETVVSIYKPSTLSQEESEGFISHHTNATQVTIAPRGIGTEGRTSESEEVNRDLTRAMEEMVRQFIFSDTSEPFAYFITFENTPESWGEAGFVWAAAEIHNQRTECGDESKSIEECNQLMDGTRIFGNVESSEWQQVQDILATFEFTE